LGSSIFFKKNEIIESKKNWKGILNQLKFKIEENKKIKNKNKIDSVKIIIKKEN